MKKRFLSIVLILLMLCGSALGDARIEGEVIADTALVSQLLGDAAAALLEAFSGDVEVESGVSGAAGTVGNEEIYVNFAENAISFAMADMYARGEVVKVQLPAENPLDQINAWLDAQGPETVFSNAVYSSLFTRALSADLTSDMIAPALSLLLPADMAAALQAQPGTVWGRVTRYKADEKQYPDLSLLTVTLDIPGLPHVYVWLRSDEFGMSLKLGVETAEVIDWDETLLVLEEGGSETGFVVNAFTLVFEDKKERNDYLEVAITTHDARMVAECDFYLSYTQKYLWAVEMLFKEEELGDMIELELKAKTAEGVEEVSLEGLKEMSLTEYLLTVQK